MMEATYFDCVYKEGLFTPIFTNNGIFFEKEIIKFQNKSLKWGVVHKWRQHVFQFFVPPPSSITFCHTHNYPWEKDVSNPFPRSHP